MRQINIFPNRSRFSFVFLAFVAPILSSYAVFGQTPNDIHKLSLSQPIKRPLKIGEVHTYQINLEAGQFMRAEVNQSMRLDVLVSLYAPDGKLLIDMNAQNSYLWRETLSCITTVNGTYRFEVKTVGRSAVPGTYVIKVDEVREPTEQDRKRIAAEQALSKGRNLYERDNPSLADVVTQLETAVSLWREVGDKYWEAVTLTNLGWVQTDASQNDKAIDSLSQALKIFKDVKDMTGEGKAANGLGLVYKALEQYEKAQDYYEQALAIRREMKDQRGVGIILHNLGASYQTSGRYKKAQDYYEQALAIRRETKDKSSEGVTLHALGFLHMYFRQYEKSRVCFEQALAVRKAAKDRGGESYTLKQIGLLYVGLRQFEKAESYCQQALVIARELNDRSNEFDLLCYMGLAYSGLSQYEKARDYYEQALVMARTTKDRTAESTTLNSLGSIFTSLGQYEKAESYCQQALDIQRELKNRSSQIGSISNLAIVYLNINQYEKARDYYEQALSITRELKDRIREGYTLGSLGLAHTYLRQHEKARDYYEQALAIVAGEAKDKVGEADMRSFLGMVYSNLRQYDKAQKYYEQALALRRKMKDRRGQSSALSGIGDVCLNLNQYDKARSYYEQALAIRRETKDRQGEGFMLNSLGSVYWNLNQFEKARDYYEQALTIAREVKNTATESFLLISLGNTYLSGSQREKARDYYEQALAKAREVKNPIVESFVFINLGLVYLGLNQYDKARDYYEQGLAKARELKDRSSESIALLISGVAYSDLNQPGKAQAYYEQALAMSKELKDRRREGITLGAVGYVYFNLHQYEKARDYYEQALVIAREVKNRIGESGALNGLGEVHLSLNQYEKSRGYYEQSLVIAKEVQTRGEEYVALNGLGDAYLKLSQYEKARSFYEQALAIAREVKNRKSEGKTLWNLMTLLNKQANPQLAILYGKQAINAFQEIRGNIRNFDKESQQSFLKDKESAYRTLADMLISQGRLPEAEKVLEMLKEEEFSDIKRTDGDNKNQISLTNVEKKAAAEIDQLAVLARENSELNERVAKKIATDEDRRRIKLIEAKITEANKEVTVLLASVVNVAPDQKEIDTKSSSMMTTLSELGAGTVALYTVVTNQKGWVILTTPEFRRVYPIDVTDLQKNIAEFRQTLKSDSYDPVSIAQKLYRALFLQPNDKGATLASDLKTYKAKTLMWSLDGELRYVPIATLHDGEDYLVEQYRNVVFNTASLTRLAVPINGDWSVLGLGVSKAHANFAALQAVPRELHAIIKEQQVSGAGVLPGVIRLDEAFTRESMTDELREGRPVVHIASHVSFNAESPLLSFLLLGDGSILTLEDLRLFPSLFGKVELLTLSACDTAMGGNANGKDVEGFAYAAQERGAKSVVASLWSVSDDGTEVLMREFYRIKSLNPQLSKAEALQRAQLALLGGTETSSSVGEEKRKAVVSEDEKSGKLMFKRDPKARFAHPHYWAPFVLIGNWK